MRGYWSNTRPNGQPVEAGTVCFITDLEDGSHPIATYGKDQEEVLEKLARQNANAQLAMARRNGNGTPANPPPLPAPRAISPDQVMQATEDLDDPAKSGAAIATLVESATGLDLNRIVLENFSTVAMQWEQDTPEFYVHPANQHLITQEACALAGGKLGQVTKAHLTRAFHNLQAQGLIVDHPAGQPDDNPPEPPPPPFPGENQVQRTERPRGTRFATGSRSTGFQRQAPTRTLKYSETDIRSMPLSKSRALIAANDRDYAEACEFYFGAKAATSA